MVKVTVEEKEEAAFLFARNAVGLNYKDLPPEVVDITKKGILDTLGVILPASSALSEIKALVELMREVGGKKESTILGFGDKVPAWHAGYVNGAMAHCMDYDDCHPIAGHINAPVIPAAVAMAEQQGRVHGKKLITAVALGVDMLCRLALAVSAGPGGKYHWNPMPLDGVFASAVACGKILGLDEDKMVNALGLAFIQAGGTMEASYGLDSNIRGTCLAPPGEVGVRVARMAQRGITGVRNSLEGRAGLMNAYFSGEYDRSVLIGDLGSRFPAIDDGFKPWPSCAGTHIYIDTTLELVREYDLLPEQVEAITVIGGNTTKDLCVPLEVKRRPTTIMVAKFSIPFTVAVAVARRKVGLSNFLGDALNDQAVLELAQRVSYRFDHDFNVRQHSASPPGKVEIKTKGSKTYSRRQDIAYGHPQKPMSLDDLATKFRDCATYSAKPLSQKNVEKAIEMLTHLEEVDDVSQIPQLLA